MKTINYQQLLMRRGLRDVLQNKKVIGKLPFYTAKKYKFMSELNRNTGINRKSETGKKEPSKRLVRKEKLQETITTFLNREDNSE